MINTSPAMREHARQKNYTGAAAVVFLLYWLFFVPGAVVNYLYLKDAQEHERLAEMPLPGVEWLTMLWGFALLVGVLAVLIPLLLFFLGALGFLFGGFR